MTIAAAYLTSEGVVLGADSQSTIADDKGNAVQLLSHEQKVFEIGEASTWGLCTWGEGRVGSLSHRTIAALVGDRIAGRDVGIDDVVSEITAIIVERIRIKDVSSGLGFGYFVGGHGKDRMPKCAALYFQVTGTDAAGDFTYQTPRRDLTVGNWLFQGAPDYHARVFHGVSLELPKVVLANIKRLAGPLPPNFDAAFVQAFGEALVPFSSDGFHDLPLREAIDYVHAYIHLTIKAFKFRYGTAICGGPPEIAYISTDRKYRWARHKRFDSAIVDHHRNDRNDHRNEQ